mmetsp:Transcript_4405/g.12468  ORF Transcript_4405/g.12468 Transcript_4405/m.12468 type:complete len:234 (+) Transcript_4405:377-1078(+)
MILRAIRAANRLAKAAAPGEMHGMRPSAKGRKLANSWATESRFKSKLRASLVRVPSAKSATGGVPLPCTRSTILWIIVNASWSSSESRSPPLFLAPRNICMGHVMGSESGPKPFNNCVTATRDKASTAATPSSISISWRKLPSGEKITDAMSCTDLSICTGGSGEPASKLKSGQLVASVPGDTVSAFTKLCDSPAGRPAFDASAGFPVIKFVNFPKPFAISSILAGETRLCPL